MAKRRGKRTSRKDARPPTWPKLPGGLPDLAAAFREGEELEDAGGTPFTVGCRALAPLAVTSGRVVACDPLTSPETEALPVALPIGKHPVFASVAQYDDGDERLVAVAVVVSDDEPARWERLPTYEVQSAVGSFMDLEAADRAVELDETFVDELAALLERSAGPGWVWASAEPGEEGANVVAFSTAGEADVVTYAARSSEGDVVALVSGCGLIAKDAPRANDAVLGSRLPGEVARTRSLEVLETWVLAHNVEVRLARGFDETAGLFVEKGELVIGADSFRGHSAIRSALAKHALDELVYVARPGATERAGEATFAWKKDRHHVVGTIRIELHAKGWDVARLTFKPVGKRPT